MWNVAKWLVGAVLSVVLLAFNKVWAFFVDFAMDRLEFLWARLPDTMTDPIDTAIVPYLPCMQYWFPLKELMAVAVWYYSFVFGWTVYRLIKSWIPTVSGS